MRDFLRDRLTPTFEDRSPVQARKAEPTDEILQQRKADYDFGNLWPLERARFIAADHQARGGEHYF